MSRVGKHAVNVPSSVNVALQGQAVQVKGKLGEQRYSVPDELSVSYAEGKLAVKPRSDSRRARMLWGTARQVLQGMVEGVNAGFTKKLDIEGVGFRAALQGKDLVLQIGFSHEVRYPVPAGITIKAEKPTNLVISGADKQQVGQVAAEIRGLRPPEPYKGKGIRYQGEAILRKEGKKK